MSLDDDATDGTTPLDPNESEGLIPTHITTMSELNEWEQANIVQHHVVQEPVSGTGIVQRQDVRMMKLRCDLDLLKEYAQRLQPALPPYRPTAHPWLSLL